MSPVTRRVVYLVIYEALAIAVVTLGLSFASGQTAEHTSFAAIGSSVIAVVWNFTFNTAFEAWESRQVVRGRSFRRRAAHALLFEAGLVIMLVPLFAWWLDMSLLDAFILDIGLTLFFLVYTFVYNLGFDTVFGLPASAQP
ncbi:PACE efflux transporter [Xanthobacter sp. TB0136]|uniref:PACE efflux transporter n=1 Tax=Xanthobacter sp. TB0136 TaxID=3459177 RepID=UPI0040391C4B